MIQTKLKPKLGVGYGLFDDLYESPALCLAQRAAGCDFNRIAFLAGVVFVVHVELGFTLEVLAVLRVLGLEAHGHGAGLITLIAGYNADASTWL